MDNLSHIIKDDGIHMRTTHYASLNDYSKLYWGRTIQLDVLEHFKDIGPEPIVDYYEDGQIASLSMYGNSLPYRGSNGISIGIKGLSNKSDDYYVLKVVYGKREWSKLLGRFTDTKLSSLSLITNFIFAPFVIKHQAFEYEQEVR